MSIFRGVSFLGFALVSLVVLAGCGGDGDGAFRLPAPGEYSFEVTGTMEVEIVREQVSAAPLAPGPETGEFSGSLTIQLGEDGSFTIKDKEGVNLVVGDLEGGPITFTQNEDKPSTIKIPKLGGSSKDPVKMTVWLNAESIGISPSGQPTNVEPIELESDGDLFSDEGATFTPPPDAEPVSFTPVEGYGQLRLAVMVMLVVQFIRESMRECSLLLLHIRW